LRANARQEPRFFAPLRMTLARLVILNEVKDLGQQNDPLLAVRGHPAVAGSLELWTPSHSHIRSGMTVGVS